MIPFGPFAVMALLILPPGWLYLKVAGWRRPQGRGAGLSEVIDLAGPARAPWQLGSPSPVSARSGGPPVTGRPGLAGSCRPEQIRPPACSRSAVQFGRRVPRLDHRGDRLRADVHPEKPDRAPASGELGDARPRQAAEGPAALGLHRARRRHGDRRSSSGLQLQHGPRWRRRRRPKPDLRHTARTAPGRPQPSTGSWSRASASGRCRCTRCRPTPAGARGGGGGGGPRCRRRRARLSTVRQAHRRPPADQPHPPGTTWAPPLQTVRRRHPAPVPGMHTGADPERPSRGPTIVYTLRTPPAQAPDLPRPAAAPHTTPDLGDHRDRTAVSGGTQAVI